MTLEVIDIMVKYGGVTAVDSVAFTIEPGEILGIIGPNGSGKTTLLNAVTGFAHRRRGVVIVDGKDVTGLPPERLIAVGLRRTFQASRHLRWLTVADHIEIAGKAASGDLQAEGRSRWWFRHRIEGFDRRTTELVEALGIAPHLHDEPHELPYGLQRNLGLLTAVVGSPRYVLLDEPTSGLHQQEADEVAAIIRRLSEQGMGIGIVDHNMRFLRALVGRILALEAGRVVGYGPTEDVLDSEEVRRVYLGTAG